MEEKELAFTIGDKVKVANDLETVFEVILVHPDGMYDLKPIPHGAILTGVAELQISDM